MKSIFIAATALFALTTAQVQGPSSLSSAASSIGANLMNQQSNGNPAPHLLPKLNKIIHDFEAPSQSSNTDPSSCPAEQNNLLNSIINYIKTEITKTFNGFVQVPNPTPQDINRFVATLMNLQNIEMYLMNQVSAQNIKPCSDRNYDFTSARSSYVHQIDSNYWNLVKNLTPSQSNSQGSTQGQIRKEP